CCQCVPVTLADQQGGPRERSELSRVICVVMANADVLDLLRTELQLAKLIDQTHFRTFGQLSQRVSSVPYHVLGPMPNQVAAVSKPELEMRVRVSIGESRYINGCWIFPAGQSSQGHLR